MALEIGSIRSEIDKARESLQSAQSSNPIDREDDAVRLLMEAEIRNLKEQQDTDIDKQIGYDGMNIGELEAVIIKELEDTCSELEYSLSFYQHLVSEGKDDKEDLNKQKENLNEILNEFQNQNEENTRLIDSLHEVDSSVYKTEVDSYKKENSRLQKANGILISEIKDLLVMCYDHRRSNTTDKVYLSREILSILEDCLNRSKRDKYISVSPEVASGEAVQLLLSAHIIQRHRSSPCRFCIADYYS